MANEKIEELKVHPLVAAQEKSGETTVEFRGFVGTRDDDVLRLYTDLEMSSYVDIPKDAVVYVEKDPDGVTGKVRAFVSPDKKVTEVFYKRLPAYASSLIERLSPEQSRMLREGLKPVWWPCEAAFAGQAPSIREKKDRAARIAMRYGVDDIRYRQAISDAIQAEDEAVGKLHQCLTQYAPSVPIILGLSMDESIAHLVGSLTKKYL